MNTHDILTAGLADGTIHQTPMELPPLLLDGVGYGRAARSVSLYWLPGGDELMVDDGQIAFTGRWHAYVAWTHHPYVRWQTPIGFAFGASDMQNTHRWLIDRTAGIVYAGLDATVRQVVRHQWPPAPPAPPVRLTSDEWQEIADNVITHVRQAQPPSRKALMEAMEAEARLSRELTVWLDQRYAALVVTQAAPVPLKPADLLGAVDSGDQAAADARRRHN